MGIFYPHFAPRRQVAPTHNFELDKRKSAYSGLDTVLVHRHASLIRQYGNLVRPQEVWDDDGVLNVSTVFGVGTGVYCNGGNGMYLPGYKIPNSEEYTYAAVMRIVTINSGSQRFFAMGQTQTPGGGYDLGGPYFSSTGTFAQYFANGAALSSSSPGAPSGHLLYYLARHKRNETNGSRLYARTNQGNIYYDQTTITAAGSTSYDFIIGRNWGINGAPNFVFHSLFVWNRALSHGEALGWIENPWGLLQEPKRYFYIPSVVGGDYSANLTAPAFGFTSQNLSILQAQEHELSSPAFDFTPQSLTYFLDVARELTTPSFAFTPQTLTWELAANTEYRSSSNDSKDAGTSLTINVPAGTVDGDQLYLFVAATGSSGVREITGPAGWTLLEENNAIGGDTAKVFSIFERRASSEPASYNVSVNLTSIFIGEIITVAQALHFDYTTLDNGSTSTPDPPASGLSAPNGSVALTGQVSTRGNTASLLSTPPLGYTEAQDVNKTPSQSTALAVAYQNGVNGTVDPGVFTLANTGAAETFTLIARIPPTILDLTVPTFSFLAQSITLDAAHSAELTAPAFGFSALSLTLSKNVVINLTTPIFAFIPQDMAWLGSQAFELSTPTFSFTPLALGITFEAFVFTTPTFEFTAQDLTWTFNGTIAHTFTLPSFEMTTLNLVTTFTFQSFWAEENEEQSLWAEASGETSIWEEDSGETSSWT